MLATKGTWKFLLALVLIGLAGCVPCDCEEATLDPTMAQRMGLRSLKITFDDPLFGDDTFQITAIDNNNQIRVIGGTWTEDDDTITFRASGEEEFLSLRSGQINQLECAEDGSFTITPPNNVPLKFFCTRRR